MVRSVMDADVESVSINIRTGIDVVGLGTEIHWIVTGYRWLWELTIT